MISTPSASRVSPLARFRSIHSFALAYGLSATIAIVMVATSQPMRHWFVVPVVFCGTLIGEDAIDWLLGKVDIYDVVGITGVLGYHFFFVAPLLHVYLDYWMGYITPPEDWRPWLGMMAALNCAGLVVYRSIRWRTQSREGAGISPTMWKLDVGRFVRIVIPLLFVTGFMQIWVYLQAGGIMGYITAIKDPGAFEGLGWVFMVSESFPILLIMVYAVITRNRGVVPTWATIFVVLTVYTLLTLLFGGLRGSRATLVWGQFWALGIVHFWIRPVPKKVVYAGLGFFVVFMYLYGFYKTLNVDAVRALSGAEDRSNLEQETGRTFPALLLGDLSRADIQAFLAYRMVKGQSYDYALGLSYWGDVALIVPKAIWPDRPRAKRAYGTDALYGQGSFDSGHWTASNIYGLAGEAMLNYGPIAVPLTFVLFGLVICYIRRFVHRLRPGDARWLIVPLIVNIGFWILVSDLDNVMWVIVKSGTVPALLLLWSTRRLRLRERPRPSWSSSS